MRPIHILIAVIMACSVAGVGLAWEKSQNHNANRATANEPLPRAIASSDLQALATRFVKLLAKEDFARAVRNFDSTMKAAIPPDKLQETWQAIISQIGQFKRIASVRTEKSGEYDVVFVTGFFEKDSLDIKVVFNSDKQIAGLFFLPSPGTYQPPAYVNPDAFKEQEVMVGTGESALPGSLTLPLGNGPFPAVVLVHGSGPNDRDETIGPNKPFRDLAQGLASKGIAVLRYEKRTRVYPGQFAGTFTVKEEVIEDAIAAVSLLRQTAGINPQKIYVLGHSLGGMLIPRIGTLDPKIAGLIVMAGPTRPFEDLFLEQIIYITSLDGVITSEEQAQIDEVRRNVVRIKDPQLSRARATQLLLGVPSAYWLDLREYNPPAVAQKLAQPMLILQGERDYQVTMEDFQGWQQALSSRQNVSFKSYPQLNHLFIAGTGKSTPAEYQTSGHVESAVIIDISNWIEELP